MLLVLQEQQVLQVLQDKQVLVLQVRRVPRDPRVPLEVEQAFQLQADKVIS